MNEKNFNSISKFEVPKSWIDGALSVPATHKKKPFPLIKLTRTLVAVACLVLVCGLSVALYFITDDSSIPPVKDPIATENYIIDGSSDTDETHNINKENEDSSENNGINKGEKPTLSGLENEDDEVDTENGTGSHPEPNEKPQKPTTNKPEKPDSTKPSENETNPQNPQQPTQPKPYDPPLQTEAPTEDDNPPPWTPTESPTYPKPPIDPTEPPWVDPTEAPTECPTEGPYPPPTEEPTVDKDFRVFVRVDENKLTSSQKVYCAFYDPDGVLVGDNDNMLAPFRIMGKGISYGGTVGVHYYPYRMLDITVSGLYRYTFYNENGEILYENTTYLTAEK